MIRVRGALRGKVDNALAILPVLQAPIGYGNRLPPCTVRLVTNLVEKKNSKRGEATSNRILKMG